MENQTRIPQHISIIMDGNGRWAKLRGKNRVEGHIEGVRSVREVVRAAADAGVRYLSLYAFSEENWNRPEQEVSALMELFAKSLLGEKQDLIENGVHLRVLGNRARLSAKLNALIDKVEETTEAGARITLILFVSYSGQWDILQASKKIAAKMAADPAFVPSADDFSAQLVTAGVPDPDLLIRTSGEERLSNYLLWQCAYTEFVFTDTLWPDFRKEALMEAIACYAQRDRRYGKIKTE